MPGMKSPSHCCVHSTRHSRTASDHKLGGSGARSLHEAEAAQHGADSCRLPRLRKEPLSLPARPSVRPSVHSSVHPELASCLSKALTKTPAPGWPCAVTLHSGDVYLVLERGVDRRGGQRAGRGLQRSCVSCTRASGAAGTQRRMTRHLHATASPLTAFGTKVLS